MTLPYAHALASHRRTGPAKSLRLTVAPRRDLPERLTL